MDFGALPPEVNSGRMYCGPGSAPMVAAASAWNGLAAELSVAAVGYERVITTLQTEEWLGPASTLMVEAVAPYVAWMRATAIQAEQAASQARAAAAAYETAFAAIVPPPLIAANRARLTSLVTHNVFGQNTASIAALLAILAVVPWRQFASGESPFVTMFSLAGLAAAASVVNFVVVTAAASSANSGFFSTGRMLFGLADEGHAPAAFHQLNRGGVPAPALLLTAPLLLTSIPLLYAGRSVIGAFTLVTTVSSLLFMFVWAMIIISYLVYRRRHPQRHTDSVYKMPGGVVMCWAVLVFFAFVIWTLTTETETATALAWFPLWFVLLAVGWLVTQRRQSRRSFGFHCQVVGVRQQLGRGMARLAMKIHARPKLRSAVVVEPVSAGEPGARRSAKSVRKLASDDSQSAHCPVAVVGLADGGRDPQYHHDGPDR